MPAPEDTAPSSSQSERRFEDLVSDSELKAALTKLKISTPTPVQQATIPAAEQGGDLIVQAQTGSGKTLAFVIPLLTKIKSAPNMRSTFGLIITPTRELANQVRDVIVSLTDEVRPVCLIGGASARDQAEDLGEDQRIVVGTPGRILDFLRQRKLVLRKCGYFTLDEADEMLSMGFLEDVRAILSRLPDKRQGLFISATITPRVQMLAQSFLRKPQTIIIESDSGSAPEIEHLYCEVGEGVTDKAATLVDIMETQRPRSCIIFCNTKSDTELVEVFLRRRGFDARRINSDLSQNQRERIMKRLKAGELPILIATDVAARGIDIEQLDLVINYAIHDQPETYIHRSGRTGRAGRSGRAISLVSAHDFAGFYALRKHAGFAMTKMDAPSVEEVNQARLAHFYELARESGGTVSEKEMGIAKAMLSDLGDVTEPSEELTAMLAKLYGLALQGMSKQNVQSLDEELSQNESRGGDSGGSDRRPEREPRRDRDDGYSSRHSDRGGRGGRSDRGGRGGGRGRDRGSRGRR